MVVATCAIVALTGSSVLAKGPESVTISGPGIDEPIELINSSLVGELMQQTGLWSASGDAVATSPPPFDNLGPAYMLTWINSGPPTDPVANRTIRQLLYFDTSNGPIIHTPDQLGVEGWGDSVKGWFAAPDLARSLEEMGVPLRSREGASTSKLLAGLGFTVLVLGLIGRRALVHRLSSFGSA